MDPVVRQSEEMIRKGSKSFALASRLFDTRTRQRAVMLYAWCRHCDDEIDGQELGMRNPENPGQLPISGGAKPPLEIGNCPGFSPHQALEQLRRETRRALVGEPVTDPVFLAFQRVAREARIPERHAMEFLAGFEMDVAGHHYANFDETLLYGIGRVRDIRQGPDGFIYLAIDDDVGAPTPIVRLEPVGR